jgi:hypothetical protein
MVRAPERAAEIPMRYPILVLAALSFACSTTKVTVDYDRSLDFRSFHTYSWAPAPTPAEVMAGGLRPHSTPSSLVTKQIVDAVDGQLQKKGLTRVHGGGELEVHFRVETGRGYDVASSGAGPRWRGANAQLRAVSTGSLVVDLVDRRTNELVWRAVARDEIDPDVSGEARAERLRAVAEKMFQDFPSPT